MENSSKDKIKELVGVFYRNTFKIFYINSVDGETFVKPFGYFVSLGITTSLSVLENIRSILGENGYTATLAEISSKRVGGQFLNTVTKMDGLVQYALSDDFNQNALGEKESKERLVKMKESLNTSQDLAVLKDLVPKISQLDELINRLDNFEGWDLHMIQETGNGFGILHKNVNYSKVGNLEYRLGIYVSGEDK